MLNANIQTNSRVIITVPYKQSIRIILYTYVAEVNYRLN